MRGKSALDRIKMRFEFLPNDPYKDREVIRIEVKQFGIPQVVRVRTQNNKTFRKDKYGYFRFISTPVRRSTRNSVKAKPTKKAVAKSDSKKNTNSAAKARAPRTIGKLRKPNQSHVLASR